VNHPSICKLLGVNADQVEFLQSQLPTNSPIYKMALELTLEKFHQNQLTLIFEFVAGTNLFDYMHKLNKTIPIGKQLGISVQICDAMAYVHGVCVCIYVYIYIYIYE